MRIQSRLKGAAAPVALSIALLAQPAIAQDGEILDATGDTTLADAGEVIIVTGSRISRPELAGSNPIIAVTAAQIERSGETSVVDVLVRNPALLASIDTAGAAGSSTSVGLGETGVNLLDLRNLGTNRTLVLVNGKRHVAGLPESAAVDINSIPQDLIERVDVLTGGASAVYGADGVSGVVNFILKRDFEGLTARAQTGWTTHGDGNQTIASITAGKNFSEGRGNFAVNYEYARQERVDTRQRNYLGDNQRFIGLIRNPYDFDNDDPNVPDYVPIGNTTWADSAMDGAVDLNGDGIPDYTGSGKIYDRGVLLPGSGGLAIGGDNTPRAGYYGDIVPETERHVVNVLTSYEFSPALRFFAEGKYAKMKAFSISQPSFDFYTELAADNYFLNERYGDLVQGPALISRDNFDLGQRGEYNDRETWRAVVGFEGEISEHARYELSYVYGQTKADTRGTFSRIEDRYFAALDAVDDGTGNPVCRITIDGTGEIGANYGDAPVSFQPGANSGCVPLNLLGNGVASQAAIDWMSRESTSSSKVTQHVVSGSISGDFGGLFELPGGPVGFAIGAEYRKESSDSVFDEYYQNGWYADSGQFQNSSGSFDVKEVFGELNVPLLADVPFAEVLSFGAAIRLSDYSSIGNTTAWKVDGVWAPIPDVRFRGTYSESVRAPNIGELYGAQSGGYLFIDDPCDPVDVNDGTQYRAANCQALLSGLGLTPQQIAAFSPSTDAEANTSILGFSGGNPNLQEETAKTWTAGVVLRPSFIPRLSLSFDWYDITIENAVNTATAQDIAELCVDQPTLDNQFCPSIDRDPSTGYVIGWRSGPQNVASFDTSGFDASLAYSVPLGELGRLDAGLTVGYLHTLNYYASIGADVDDDVGESFKPRWSAAMDLNWSIGRFTTSYSLTWWDKTRRFTTEQLAANPDRSDPQYHWYDPRIEHDIRVQADWDKFSIYGGINNLFDARPDLSLSYPVSAYGRFAYIGVKAKLNDLF